MDHRETAAGGGGGLTTVATVPSFTVTANSCNVQNTNPITVNLPQINPQQLSTIGSTVGSVPFSITVNCPTPTNLNITFTDNNNIGQTNNILIPTKGSTATGLSIELQHNGRIISFGPDSAEPGTTNQIVLNSNLIGTQSFPFSASYIRTGPITPGSLSATATFTLSYQ